VVSLTKAAAEERASPRAESTPYDRPYLRTLQRSPVYESAPDGLDGHSVCGDDRLGLPLLHVEELLNVLDTETLGVHLGVLDVVDPASECHPSIEELVRGDAREMADGLAIEVIRWFVSPRPRVGEGVLGSPGPQCHVPEGESEDNGNNGVACLVCGEDRPSELRELHGRRFCVHSQIGVEEARYEILATTSAVRIERPDAIALDLVERSFARSAADELWVTDITEHPTREDKVHCCVAVRFGRTFRTFRRSRAQCPARLRRLRRTLLEIASSCGTSVGTGADRPWGHQRVTGCAPSPERRQRRWSRS
jgi:hypothetical protein